MTRSIADWATVGEPRIAARHEAIFSVAMEMAETWQRLGEARRIGALAEKHGRVLQRHFR